MQEKEHILQILEQTKKAIKDRNTFKLRELSNKTVHSSSISQDSDNIAIAVVIYALEKLVQRRYYQESKEWDKFLKIYLSAIDNSITAIKKNKIDEFRQQIKLILDSINKLSGNLKEYIQDVFRKAQINKASRIYEHGISMEKTAKLLGISIWELAEYIGQSGKTNINLSITKDIRERIKLAMKIFG